MDQRILASQPRNPLRLFGAGVVWWLSMVFLAVASAPEHPPAGLTWYPWLVIFELISCWRSTADAFYSDAFRIGGRRPT